MTGLAGVADSATVFDGAVFLSSKAVVPAEAADKETIDHERDDIIE